MITKTLFFAGLAAFAVSCSSPKTSSEDENEEISITNTVEEVWRPLFNGENLDGWTMKIVDHELGDNFGNTFRVEDGIIKVRYNAYETFENRFGGLYFNKKFTDYRLKLDYRFIGEEWTKGAPEWGYRDSGVQFHCQDPKTLKIDQPFPVCLEFNLHGGNGTDERPVGEICANGINVEINGVKNESFCTPAEVKRTFHGDDWVTLEIDVQGNKISHFINGEKILSYENPVFNANHELGKDFIIDGDSIVNDGYISLQSNSHPIDFRNIMIREY